MPVSKSSLSNLLGSALYVTISNEVGFWGARFFGRHLGASTLIDAAAKSTVSVSLVGGAALYIPAYMLKQSLNHLGLMNDIANQAINMAFSCGSAALGAILLGFAVKPFLICALVGCAIDFSAVLLGFSITPLRTCALFACAIEKPDVLCALILCVTAFYIESLFWGERDDNTSIFSSGPAEFRF